MSGPTTTETPKPEPTPQEAAAAAQDAFLNERLGIEPEEPDEEPSEEPEETTEGNPELPVEGDPETPAETATATDSKPAALSDDDEAFAFSWLARAGLGRQAVNDLLESQPAVALAMARAQKQAQDTIARLRRGEDSAVDDDARPSDSAPGRTKPASPEELRRAKIVQLVEDELGEEAAQALERDLRAVGPEGGSGGPAPDPRLAAVVAATRERLIAGGHEELRGKDAYLDVLRAADALQASDPALSAADAIAEAAEIRRVRRERAQAESQQRTRAKAASQPSTGVGRGAPLGLTKEQARDRHLDALIAGDKQQAEAIATRYKLKQR